MQCVRSLKQKKTKKPCHREQHLFHLGTHGSLRNTLSTIVYSSAYIQTKDETLTVSWWKKCWPGWMWKSQEERVSLIHWISSCRSPTHTHPDHAVIANECWRPSVEQWIQWKLKYNGNTNTFLILDQQLSRSHLQQILLKIHQLAKHLLAKFPEYHCIFFKYFISPRS